jgi:methyl-accepting chemotaxis protein
MGWFSKIGFSRVGELEAKLQAIGRSQAVIEFAMDGTILTANDKFLEAMDYSMDEVRGQHHSMFVAPEERKGAAYRALWDDLNAGEYRSAEFRRLGKNGREVWIQGSYNPILNRKGKPIKVVKYATDVTAEVKSRERVALLSLVADGTDSSVVITNAAGLVQYVNAGFTRLTGYTFAEMQGKKPGKLLQGRHTDKTTIAQIRQALDARKPFYADILNYTKRGEPYWIALTINPVLAADGTLERFISIQANITKTKLESMEFAGRMNAIERANAVMEWDAQGRLVRMNETALAMCKVDSVASSKALEDLQYDRLFNDEVRAGLQGDKPLALDLMVRNAAGEEVYLSATVQALRDVEGAISRVVLYGIDVTARRKAVLAADSLMSGVLKRISQVATEITSISYQTDILAVNAAIEAAHAGEAGLSFAVVAGEVRSLSARSSGSTAEIANLVSETTRRIEVLRRAH